MTEIHIDYPPHIFPHGTSFPWYHHYTQDGRAVVLNPCRGKLKVKKHCNLTSLLVSGQVVSIRYTTLAQITSVSQQSALAAGKKEDQKVSAEINALSHRPAVLNCLREP